VAAAEEQGAEATAKADKAAAKAAADAATADTTSSELHAARRKRGHRRCPSGCDEELADLTLPGPSPTLARAEVRYAEAGMGGVPMVPMGRSAEQRHVTLRLGSAFSSTCATPSRGNVNVAADVEHACRHGVNETTLDGVGDAGPPSVAAPALTGQRDVAVELSQAAAALQRIVNEEQRQAKSVPAASSVMAGGVRMASDGPSRHPQTEALREDQAADTAHLQRSSAPPTLLCPPSASQLWRRRSARQLQMELQNAKEVHPSLKSELQPAPGCSETELSGRGSLDRSHGCSAEDQPGSDLALSGGGLNLHAVDGTMPGVLRTEPAAGVGETCIDDRWTQAPLDEDMSPWVSAQAQPTWPARSFASSEPQGDRNVQAASQMDASSNTAGCSSLTLKNGSEGGAVWTGGRHPASGPEASILPPNPAHADSTPKASRESRLVHADSVPAASDAAALLRAAKARTSHLHRFSSEPARTSMRFSTNIKFVPGHSRLPSFEPDLALLMEEAVDARAKGRRQQPTSEDE
jgi:hypothetical protein